MLAFLGYWAIAFFTLVIALLITAVIYVRMGDGLDLNGWVAEFFAALFASAGQAGGYLLEETFPIPMPSTSSFGLRYSIGASIFFLSFWLCYKLAHLTTWDPLEFVILALVQISLLAIIVAALMVI